MNMDNVLKVPAGRLGEFNHPQYGRIKMTQEMFNQMIANHEQQAIGRKAFVRIAHDKPGQFGGAPSEAWIDKLVQEGPNLFALADPTNEAVVQAIKEKRFLYASPEYRENYRDKETGEPRGAVLQAIALTNEPFIPGLPEVRLLADPSEEQMFYLNLEEVKTLADKDQFTNEEVSGLKKLSEFFGAFFGGKQIPAPAPSVAIDPETQRKLADMESKIAEQNRQLAAALALGHSTAKAAREADVERKLAEYAQKGVPKVMLDQARPLLLADDAGEVIKLADGQTETTKSAQVYAFLDGIPSDMLIKMSQMGGQETPPKGEEAERKLAEQQADDAMARQGYKKDAQGRYVLADGGAMRL